MTHDEKEDDTVGSYSNDDTYQQWEYSKLVDQVKRKYLVRYPKKKAPQYGTYGVVTSFSLLYYSGCL